VVFVQHFGRARRVLSPPGVFCRAGKWRITRARVFFGNGRCPARARARHGPGAGEAGNLGSNRLGYGLSLGLWRQTGWSITPMRPFLQRVFVVLWLIWGLILGIGLFIGVFDQLTSRRPMMPFSEFLAIGVATAAGTAIPVMLLQYLVLGFFNPLRLLEAKSPPA
jgi:hypothetical protein